MIALGVDTGLANLGWALVELTPNGQRLLGLGVITTTKSDRKRNVLASADNMRRIREQAKQLTEIRAGRKTFKDVDVICCESQSWPRSAGSSAKIGMSWGIVGTVATLHDLPLVEATPQQIKKRLTGVRSASKDDVKSAMLDWAGFKKLPAMLSEYAKGKHEHAVDACGAVVTCRESDIIRALLRSER